MAHVEFLAAVVVHGLAAGVLAALVRTWEGAIFGSRFKAAWAARKQRKPVGCAVCMGTWAGLLVGGGALVARHVPRLSELHDALFIGAVAGVAVWLNSQVVPPPPLDLDNLPGEK